MNRVSVRLDCAEFVLMYAVLPFFNYCSLTTFVCQLIDGRKTRRPVCTANLHNRRIASSGKCSWSSKDVEPHCEQCRWPDLLMVAF